MEPKKSKKAELEKKKFLFLKIGFVTTLALLLIAFEWSGTTNDSKSYFRGGEIIDTIIELPPQTFPKQDPPKPPAPPDIILVHENNPDLPDDIDIPSVEFTAGTYIPLQIFSDPVDTPDPGDGFWEKVEDMPTFRGKDSGHFREWIYQHLNFPPKAIENHIQGTVYVSFIVNKDGSVSDVEIVRSVHSSLDDETVRVIASSPRWEPGRQWGKPVRVRFIFPVNFVIR